MTADPLRDDGPLKLTLPADVEAALARASKGAARARWVRNAIRATVGLPLLPDRPWVGHRVGKGAVVLSLSDEERRAVGKATAGRTLRAWLLAVLDAALRRSRRATRTERPVWHGTEEVLLQLEWGRRPIDALAAMLPGRTQEAIRRHGVDLGLPTGLPEGALWRGQLARFTGYPREVSDRIIALAGVEVRYLGGGRRPYVERAALRAATTAHPHETLTDATRRTRLRQDELRRRLLAAGFAPPRARRTWWIPSALVDAVAPPRERVSDAAARLGVHERTLRAWLGRTGRRGVVPAHADAVVATHRARLHSHRSTTAG